MLSTLISIVVFHLPSPATLRVGPGKEFARIEAAVAKANIGDTILVYPDPAGYPRTALRIQVASLTVRGIGSTPVRVSGADFDYSGSGSVPRAIIQIEPTGAGVKIENLDLSGAHNQSFNGAGIRVQGASDVTVRDCNIHHNDMGIMSNGKEGDPKSASNQLIEYCLIERNGNVKDPGYNHNLYLGGTSAKLFHCEIRNSTTGHNVKCRAHYIEIDGCYIHDASSREIDLPEAWDTSRANSNALLYGNRIIKDPNCAGNRGVIHFGKEKGARVGNLYLIGNTIVTPFSSPVVLVTSPGTTVDANQNVFINPEQKKAEFLAFSGTMVKLFAQQNEFAFGYGDFPGGNHTAKSRAELFGRKPPEYLAHLFDLTGDVPSATWLDGEGKGHTIDPPRMEMSRHVGPRELAEYRGS